MSKKITINELFEKVWDEHWNCDRYLKSGHAKEVRYNYNKRIKDFFGDQTLARIKVLDVKKWHQRHKDLPFAANRALEVLSRLFEYAAENGINQYGFNPCRGVKHFTEKSRARYATAEEIQKIGEVLVKYQDKWPLETALLFTILYTGARPRSLQRANWHDLSQLEGGFGVLIFEGKSTAKTGDNERVIFPPNIMEMIAKLPKRRDNLIFGIGIPKDKWHQIRKEAGCPDLYARDLRRTFATVGMSNCNIKMETIGELLNHRSAQTTKVYARLDNRARIEAVTEISKKISELFDKKKVS